METRLSFGFGTGISAKPSVSPPGTLDGELPPTWTAFPASELRCSEIDLDPAAAVPRDRQCDRPIAVRTLVQLYAWLGSQRNDVALTTTLPLRGGIFTYRDLCVDHFLEYEIDEALLAGAL